MIYIPREWEAEVREWVERHAHVRELLEHLSSACLQRLKSRQR